MRRMRRTILVRSAAFLAVVLLMLPITRAPANAAPALSLSPITWGVVGLDSNDVNSGPNQFAEGARLCNSGSSAATDLTATFLWDSANSYISLYGLNPIGVTSLAAGACTDLYFNIQIQRTSSAYDTSRRFHIEVSGTGISTVSTPTPREAYVEHLVSQNRNTITSVTGPTTVTVGNTYTYVYTSKTAPGGYEQVSTFLNWPNTIFQILSVSATYTAPSGGTNDTIYADACGWDPDPTSADYRSCVGPVNYTGGKAGGTMVMTYTVKILSAGTANMGGLVYDFSGSSYHYNSDWSATLYSVTAVNSADVSITKSGSPGSVNAGEDVTYSMHVANAGPGTATAVSVGDTLPAGTSFVSADHGGSLSGGTVTWNLGDLASGDSLDLSLVLEVDPGRIADVTNTATASTTASDPDASNDTDSATTTVNTSANLSLVKSDSPDPVQVGQNLTYTLDVANAGPSDARNVTVTDTLPAGVTYVSSTPTQGTCSEASLIVTCTLGTVAAGASPTITIVVSPSVAGGLSNTATVSSTTSDPDVNNDTDTEDTTVSAVQASADLSITKSDDVDPVDAGADLTYTLTVSNAGPNDGTNTVVTDMVPAGTSFVSADAGGIESGGMVTWNLGDVASGGSTTVHLVVHVDPARTLDLSNTATVGSAVTDPDATDNIATEPTAVQTLADLSITKTASAPSVNVGDEVTYTLTSHNAGPSDATNVTVTDPLPAGVAYDSATPSKGTCTEASGTVTCQLGTIASGSDVTIEVVVTTLAVGDVTNSATASSDVSDPNDSNNVASATTTVNQTASGRARADLAVSKTSDTDRPPAGGTITYTIVVANDGPGDATGVVVADALPHGLSYLSSQATQGAYALTTGLWTAGSIADGSSATLVMRVRVDAVGGSAIENVATIAGLDQKDPDTNNDEGIKTVHVLGASGGNGNGANGVGSGGTTTASTGRDLRGLGLDMLGASLLGVAALSVARRRRVGGWDRT
jgi:uncharacterized repeat protein (TIGR01451 family)